VVYPYRTAEKNSVVFAIVTYVAAQAWQHIFGGSRSCTENMAFSSSPAYCKTPTSTLRRKVDDPRSLSAVGAITPQARKTKCGALMSPGDPCSGF